MRCELGEISGVEGLTCGFAGAYEGGRRRFFVSAMSCGYELWAEFVGGRWRLWVAGDVAIGGVKPSARATSRMRSKLRSMVLRLSG